MACRSRIRWRTDPRETDNGLDDDRDGFIDEGSVELTRDVGAGTQRVVTLVKDVREYLEWIRSLVGEGQGKELDGLKAELEPKVQERYSDWDNPIWIGFAIENFRGELDG